MLQRLATPPQPGGSGGAPAAPRPPALVAVCMIYYLDEAPGGSYADHFLARLGYGTGPTKLKSVIKFLFETNEVKDFQAQAPNKESSSHAGKQVSPFPLFEVLGISDTND
jgi:hypothetical protein